MTTNDDSARRKQRIVVLANYIGEGWHGELDDPPEIVAWVDKAPPALRQRVLTARRRFAEYSRDPNLTFAERMGALIAEIQFVETGSHDLTEDEVADINAIISDGFNRQLLEDFEAGGKPH